MQSMRAAHGDGAGGLSHASASAQGDAVNLLEDQLFPKVPERERSRNTLQEGSALVQ